MTNTEPAGAEAKPVLIGLCEVAVSTRPAELLHTIHNRITSLQKQFPLQVPFMGIPTGPMVFPWKRECISFHMGTDGTVFEITGFDGLSAMSTISYLLVDNLLVLMVEHLGVNLFTANFYLASV